MRAGERGSALIIAVLVMVILTLLGISFLLLAETENRIAENERLASQALYFAEAGTRAVIQWFNDPGGARNLANPPIAALDRSKRQIDDDGDPGTPAHDLDGTTWLPYKQDVDLDLDGVDDVFDRPYRRGDADTFRGLELGNDNDGLLGPDIRIDGAVAGPARDFLEQLSEALMAGYPNAAAGIHARIARIDIYAPPSLRIGGNWTRFGIATVRVVGQIVRTRDDGDEVMAERVVKAVLNEIPYTAPYGPIHSCGGLTLRGPLSAHWGAVTAVDDVRLDADHNKIPASLPRVAPAGARIDLLWGFNDATVFNAYLAGAEGLRVEDPWLRVMAGSALSPSLTSLAGSPPSHQPGGIDGDHTNLFRDMTLVGCPELDYDLWKTIAMSGQEGVEYWAWVSGDTFKRDGVGVARTFREITDVDPADPTSRPAILFFDTKDGSAPHDDDANGTFDNLTPGLAVAGVAWAPRGVVYLNAESLRTADVLGRPDVLRPPAEPFRDANQDGVWDAGEEWVNLEYGISLVAPIRLAAANLIQDDGITLGTVPMRNDQGPAIAADVAFDGILFTNGTFDATGPALYYGSVIARGDVIQPNPVSPTVEIYWNDAIRTGKWPPAAWGLPRVVVTRWETGL